MFSLKKKNSPFMSHSFQMDLLLTRSFMMSPLNLRNILDVQLIFSSSSSAPTNRHALITHVYSLSSSPSFEISCIAKVLCVSLRQGNEIKREAFILYLYSNTMKKEISPHVQ